MSDEDLLHLKKTLTFWDKLTLDEQEELKRHVHTASYQPGETIHGGDNNCLGVLIVKQGCIRSYMLSNKGKDITLYRLYPGEICMLSASCVLSNVTFDIHVDSESKTEVLVISSHIFSRLMAENIYVENFSYKATADKFSDVMWAMEQILFMNFDQRLAIFLLDEANKNNTYTIHLTHEQIAKYMGSAREVVSRMIKYFVSEGLITSHRGEIKLIDLAKLKKLALQSS